MNTTWLRVVALTALGCQQQGIRRCEVNSKSLTGRSHNLCLSAMHASKDPVPSCQAKRMYTAKE